jgi:prevent-host-death family protein
MAEVSIREFRNNLTRYLRLIEDGERITVTRRGKPVATIEPCLKRENDADEWLWKALREGKISWSGKKFRPAPPTVKLKGQGPTGSEMIIEGRG